MKCPKCGKDVILQKKQVGVDENGDPILNEYAICKDCKKQWNLDKQRAKKAASEPASPVSETEHKEIPQKQEKQKAPVEKTEEKQKAVKKDLTDTSEKQPAQKKKRPASERPLADPSDRPKKKRLVSESSDVAQKKNHPVSADSKTRVISLPDELKEEEEQRYSNIPSEKVRAKRERAVKKNYENMLASDPDRKPVHKRKPAPKPVEEPDKFEEEDDYEEDYIVPKFRVLRVLFGLLSIVAFGFFTYKGVISGLDSITSGSNSNIGTFYVIMALCMLTSGLLLLILQKSNTIFAFLFPMLFYLGCGVIAFLKRSDDKMLLYCMIACAVLAVIFLILTILSRRDTDEEDEVFDDYDDAFEDDYDDY